VSDLCAPGAAGTAFRRCCEVRPGAQRPGRGRARAARCCAARHYPPELAGPVLRATGAARHRCCAPPPSRPCVPPRNNSPYPACVPLRREPDPPLQPARCAGHPPCPLRGPPALPAARATRTARATRAAGRECQTVTNRVRRPSLLDRPRGRRRRRFLVGVAREESSGRVWWHVRVADVVECLGRSSDDWGCVSRVPHVPPWLQRGAPQRVSDVEVLSRRARHEVRGGRRRRRCAVRWCRAGSAARPSASPTPRSSRRAGCGPRRRSRRNSSR
jgi:hypothetical protein